ncbi:translational activator of GCN4, partial [Ascosphaera acerosa]
ASRQCVQRCLRSLFGAETTPANILPAFVHKLKKESDKTNIAAVNAFVLLEWCCLLLQHLSDDTRYDAQLAQDVILADARFLELTLAASSKEGLRHSSVIVTRRALRAAFSSAQHGADLVKLSVELLATGASASARNACFLGIIAGVTARQPANKPAMETVKPAVFAYYAKEIVGSRVILPKHITDGLGDFFLEYATLDDLRTTVFPPVEKAMLRAPEVVLNGVILSLFHAIPDSINLSEDITARFIKPLLSSIKSANAATRNGAFTTGAYLLTRCTSHDWLKKTVDEIAGPIKANKVPNAEQRCLQVQLLQSVLCSDEVSPQVLSDLIPTLAREANEAALDAEIIAFVHHLQHLLQSGTDVSKDILTAITSGCGDKRPNFRRLWLLHIAQAIWNLTDEQLSSSETVSQLVETVLGKFQDPYAEICANPLPSLQNGTVTLGYCLVALACGRLAGVASVKGTPYVADDNIGRAAIVLSPKPSFLLNPRVYTKLTSPDDYTWFIRALSATTNISGFFAEEPAVKHAWAHAFVYLLSARNAPPRVREASLASLADLYLKSPEEVGTTVIEALWHWLHDLSSGEKDSAAVACGMGNARLSLAVRAITPPRSAAQSASMLSARESQLVRLLVLCHFQLIPGSRWIDVALRAGVDPAYLVSQNPEACLAEVTRTSDDPLRKAITGAQAASWEAVADLVFVAPDAMMSRVVEQLEKDLDAEKFRGLSVTDIGITRTPEGTTFIDVLDTKSSAQVVTKGKDADTLKWEAELRAQLAQKKGQTQKKLTPDQKAKVEAQLAKEAAIRKDVQQIECVIKRGAGTVEALSRSIGTVAEGWINPAVRCLTALSQANVGALVGDAVAKAYLACSAKVSGRLGDIRPFIGVATLRAFGNSHLGEELEVEPLGALVTRVLYRIRLASEQLPFDVPSLSYFLPLLFAVLDKNGINEAKDVEGEQRDAAVPAAPQAYQRYAF